MAATLKYRAALSVKQATSAFYEGDKNPVYNAFSEEYRLFIQYMQRKVSTSFRKKDDEPFSRGSNTLFTLWNNYQARLPETFFQKKVIEMGDFLVTIKEYNLAVWQCYGRYLDQFGDQHIENITDISNVVEIFFPDGLETQQASLTFRALYGKSICNYQLVLLTDPKLQNSESVAKCLKILAFLRLITQVVLPKEPLCWLVYNGTIHIYSVSRHLMTLGHSAKVLEYLLWACMCTENSVPLMSVRYLQWRTTLYTAVCQCYYDCKTPQHAENFARRALGKVNELSQLEKISSSTLTAETEAKFRQSAVKLGIMIFKRSVFDARKRTKGLLRPKTRSNLKDSQSQPWPRTAVEKLLSDMFEGSAAQFLAILETLADSTRRTLLTSPAAADTEDHILDTFSELFFAGLEIISGGGGHDPRTPQSVSSVSLAGVIRGFTLIDRATSSEDGVPISSVVKFLKCAYNYEQWEVYDMLVQHAIDFIKNDGDPQLAGDLKSLEILQVMEPLNPKRKSKRSSGQNDDGTLYSEPVTLPLPPSAQQHSSTDNLVLLAEIIFACSRDPASNMMDKDMIVDATLLIWSKCKAVFQKFQTGASDSTKYLQRMENPGKWIHILSIIQEVMYWCGIGSVDPSVTAEVAIRLALVLESNATNTINNKDTDKLIAKVKELEVQSESTKYSPGPRSDKISVTSISGRDTGLTGGGATLYTTTVLQQGPEDQLLLAREFLERALQGMSAARSAVATTDGDAIADVSWIKTPNNIEFTASPSSGGLEANERSEAVHHTIKDLHLELLYMFHRVCLKLAGLLDSKKTKKGNRDVSARTGQRMSASSGLRMSRVGQADLSAAVDTSDELITACGKNLISKALFNMQKALQSGSGSSPSQAQMQCMEEALTFITKAQEQEQKLHGTNTQRKSGSARVSGVPPPPLLVCRMDKTMVFKPAPFNPSQKVAWYRIFARPFVGSNVKVRLNDYNLPGTGDEVPAYDCELTVSGLTTNDRYVFAVAAYTATGELIGSAVGDTSKPILASHPLPILMSWAFLSQAAYQVGCYSIGLHASTVLWNHFVVDLPPPKSDIEKLTAKEDYKLALKRLNPDTASVASPLLLRMFLSSIFINVDVSIREGSIFCNKLCDEGPYYSGQIQRLGECERMLVALELAGWLNESNLALQAVVQCYGLLAPLIYYKIPSAPVVQILIRCYAVLQETPVNLRQRRQQTTTDSLHHMLASITFYLAKVLRVWKQRNLSNHISDSGKKMLAIEKEVDKSKTDPEVIDDVDSSLPIGQAGLQANRRKRTKRQGQQNVNLEGTQNEELRALEAHILKLSKLAHNTEELTGSEDPNILHAFIATLPSRYAYKEVVKFRRRARYLEFFVQVVQKALSEGLVDIATEWCEETIHWLIRRNEQLSAIKATINKQAGGLTLAGDDTKKYAAAVVEFSKQNKPEPTKAATEANKPSPRRRKKKLQLLVHLRTNLNMSDAALAAQEAKEMMAFEKLEVFFGEFYRTQRRKQRLRKICSDEMPWRSHMNVLQGLCHFAQFLGKIEKRNKLLGPTAGDIYRSSYLDNDWFTFDTVGTLLVGWDGGPSRSPTRHGDNGHVQNDPIIAQLQQLDADEVGKAVTTAIEVAALATVGEPVVRVPPPPDDKVSDTLQTYHSSESDKDAKGGGPQMQPPHDISGLSSQATLESLSKSFSYLKKAVVLAHRGGHWNLLQNACRAMWNCAHTALLHCFSEGFSNTLVSVDALRGIVWKPFYLAVDCLLDMMIRLQTDKEKDKTKKGLSKEGGPRQAWVGDVSNEKGGASLKFEPLCDDVSFIDSRWSRRLVVRVMEMLYYEQQWERLADVAMKFNMLTNERYSEHLSPVLVQAQRKLVSRVHAYGGPPPEQPHFRISARAYGGESITAENYMFKQLRVEVNTAMLPPIETGGRIDPEGHNVYEGASDAFKLVSVPLNIKGSLSSFREVLDQSSYTSRALQHSRKLLILYLASQQNASTSTVSFQSTHSHVGFSETDDNPQMPTPPDLTKAEFRTIQEIQTPALPKSQLGVVLSSYDKTIEILLGRKQNSLAAQAMHELGNIHYHSGNIRVAFRWWSEALDLIMSTEDTLHTWRELVRGKKQNDISTFFMKKCGIWGCILGAVLATKIAQYVLTSDLGLRLDSCFLAAYLFKALFRTTLPHPTADRDYALYDIGEGCEVQYLVPGMDLLSDKFRCDGRTLVAALRWVTEELSRGRHNLMVLPLLTLYQYLTTYVCRDLQRAVDGRILKVRILTDLGLYSEAFTVLSRLLHGERLPQTADNNFRQVESKMPTQKFNTSKPLLEPINLKMLEYLLDKRLSPSLGTLYGPHLTCHLSLVQAHLMVSLSETIHALPDQEDVNFTPQAPQRKPPSPTSVSTHSRAPTSIVSKKDKQTAPRVTLRDCVASDDEASQESVALTEDTTKKFTGGKKPLTLERIKGVLLKSAEDMLKLMVEVLQGQSFGNISAAELELITLAKLEMSAIFQQRHLSVSAAEIVVSAMKSLQESDLFKEATKHDLGKRPSSMRGSRQKSFSEAELQMTTDDSPSQFQYQNSQSRSRLDGRLWLSCRLTLVKSLMGQVRGMGTLGMQRSSIPDCRQMCMEALTEAEACGDAEMQAELFMQGALLDLQDGRDVKDIKETLQEVLKLLEMQQTLSPPGGLLHALAKIQYTDLDIITGQRVTTVLKAYHSAQNLLLEQMMHLGEKIDQHKTNSYLSTLASPLANIYLPHLPYLVKNKMRIGHTLARQAAVKSNLVPASPGVMEGPVKGTWLTSASVLSTALELAQITASKENTLIAEILLHLGKVQCQIYRHQLGYPCRSAVKTLLEAIETSLKADQDLGLIRQAYTEITLTYLTSSSETEETSEKRTEPKQEKKQIGSPKKASKGKTLSGDDGESEFMRERRREQYAAWVALRAATCVAGAQRNASLLIGDPQLTSAPMKEKTLNKLPEFVQQDLLGNNPIPKAPPTPHPSPIMSQLEPVDELVADNRSEGAVSDITPSFLGPNRPLSLTWIHLVGYTSVLQRICNLGSIVLGDQQESSNHDNSDEANSEWGGSSHDIVRGPLFSSGMALRLQSINQYLITHLPYYQSCLPMAPPTLLNLPPQAKPLADIGVQSYRGNQSNIPQINLPKRLPSLKVTEKHLTACSEKDICLQWYQPSMDDIGQGTEAKILLLYTIGKPTTKTTTKSGGKSSYIINKLVLPLSELVDLHDKLAVLRQRADMSLSDTSRSASTPASTPSGGGPPSVGSPGGSTRTGSRKSRRTARIAQLSAKVKKDEDLEALLRQCILIVGETLKKTTPAEEKPPSAKLPFEVGLSNIQQFEQLFDLSYGDWLKGTKLFDWLCPMLEEYV
ncbi:cilia- and flagella-associated protein 54-like isoform X3 [Apostichopus japonicus]|uniref:cilia- and flagella-associated protein 54-like isoform X3 n=1 Tax=Stichopus japonicus TaxID=307972 RepID=UPI003AB3CEAD